MHCLYPNNPKWSAEKMMIVIIYYDLRPPELVNSYVIGRVSKYLSKKPFCCIKFSCLDRYTS